MEITKANFKNDDNYHNCKRSLKQAIEQIRLARLFADDYGIYDELNKALDVLEELKFGD